MSLSSHSSLDARLQEFAEAGKSATGGSLRSASPYPGLRPFRPHEFHLFCGRSSNRIELLARIERSRFLAVIGASGSGKSSLVMAGLLPDIARGLLLTASGRRPRFVYFKPGSNPFLALAQGFAETFKAPTEVGAIERMLRHSSAEGIPRVLSHLTRRDMASELALFVVADQFEEIFRFARLSEEEVGREEFTATRKDFPLLDTARNEAQAFADLLLQAAASSGATHVHVVLTMRSDFLHSCEAFDRLPGMISRHQYLVPRPQRRQLADAISVPATHFDEQIGPTLVNLILNELSPEQDQLPILQHALARTWEEGLRKRDKGRRMTVEHYREIGGIKDALNQHGDVMLKVLAESPERPIGKDKVGRFFRCLAERNPTGALIRRPRTVGQVSDESGLTYRETVAIADQFRGVGHHWLTPTPADVAKLDEESPLDLTHESLLRKWELYAGEDGWMADELERETQFMMVQAGMGDSLPIRYKRPLRLLAPVRKIDWTSVRSLNLSNAQVQRARQALLSPPSPTESWAGRYGGKWRETRESLKFASLKFGIARTRALAVAVLLLIVTFGWALSAKHGESTAKSAAVSEKKAAADLLEAKEKRAEAEKTKREQADNLTRAIADAVGPLVKGMERGESAIDKAEVAAESLVQSLRSSGRGIPPDEAEVRLFTHSWEAAEEFVAALSTMASALNKAVRETGLSELQTVAAKIDAATKDAKRRKEAIWRDENVRGGVSVAIDSRLKSMEATLGELLGRDSLHRDDIKDKENDIAAVTADLDALGAIMAAAKALGFSENDFEGFPARVEAIKSTLSRMQVLAQKIEKTSNAPEIIEWTLKNANDSFSHAGGINSIEFAPKVYDGKPLIVSGGADKDIRFSRISGDLLGWIATSSTVNDVAFNSEGLRIAAASNGSTVRIFHWEKLLNIAEAKRNGRAFEGHRDSITDVDFNLNGKLIASASLDRTVRVFDGGSMAQLYYTSPPLPSIVTTVDFHPDQSLVVSGCNDGGVRLHNFETPSVRVLGTFGAPARSPSFSEDGRYVIAASADKTARIWTVGEVGEVVFKHPAPVTQASFRAATDEDDYTFISTMANGEVRLYPFKGDVIEPIRLEPRHLGAVASATWSNDGQWLATVGGGEILVWEWINDRPVVRLRIEALGNAPTRAVFSPTGKFLVTYGDSERANIWALEKLEDG